VDLDEKIGQLFAVPARTGDIDTAIRHVRDNDVGGVIWFQSTAEETARVNETLQSIARTPLLISADLEAGLGMRFTDADWWLPAMALAATGDPSLAEEQGRVTAREALAIGVNHILAPVADVNCDPRNPVINTRSFGEDPDEVAQYVAAFVRGVQSEGALATAKHFPGHGDTHVDSHRALPVLDVTRERLQRVELVPFRAAVAEGVASVMVGHLAVPSLDSAAAPVRTEFENVYGTTREEVPSAGTMPATLSRPIIDVLRRELGFEGLVLTDAMDMGGLAAHFDAGEAAVRAIEAGNDMVLYSSDTDAAIAAVREAVRSGRLTEARIDESVARIMKAKREVTAVIPSVSEGPGGEGGAESGFVHHPRPQVPRSTLGMTDGNAHLTLDDIAARAITLVRDTNQLLPLRDQSIAIRVFSADDRLDVALEALSGACAIGEADVILLLLGIRPKSGVGQIVVPEEAKRIAQEHARKTIAVSFGSPYVVHDLGDVSTFICAWGPQPVMQRAAVRALRAEAPMTGRLPVTL